MRRSDATNSAQFFQRQKLISKALSAADFGETNIGMFLLKNQTMFEVLLDLKSRYWNEANR